MSIQHHSINYLELPATDLPASKAFFERVFDFAFTDYGPDYSAFECQGVTGGFYQTNTQALTASGSVLLVFYSRSLADTQKAILAEGGAVLKPTFSFPGGFRFHFTCPSGNEYAVWSETDA